MDPAGFQDIVATKAVLSAGAYLLLAVGIALSLLGFLGCCGALRRSRPLLLVVSEGRGAGRGLWGAGACGMQGARGWRVLGMRDQGMWGPGDGGCWGMRGPGDGGCQGMGVLGDAGTGGWRVLGNAGSQGIQVPGDGGC